MNTDEKFTAKRIEDMMVASIRFLGYSKDIAGKMAQLKSAVGDQAAGPEMIISYWGHIGPEQDIEVCIPVETPINTGEVITHTLKGNPVVSMLHKGSHETINVSWKQLYAYMGKHRFGWGNGPGREIYLEGPKQHGDNEENYLTELQVPVLRTEWIEKLGKGVSGFTDEKTASYVVSEGNLLHHTADARTIGCWAQGMLKRLEESVPNEQDRHEILVGCTHIFPERRVKQLREIYLDGGVQAVLDHMNLDRSEQGDNNYYESPRLEDNTIFITKIPYNKEAWDKAETEMDKKLAYCHCPTVKDAIREGIELSPTYCHCGAGWYHTLWEGILERPVRVELKNSLLKGNETCSFEIHLG